MIYGKNIIQQLQKWGSQLKKSHDFDFYLYFPTQYEANQAAIKLILEGLTCDVKPAAIGDNWLCLASIQMVPEVNELARLESTFATITTTHHGEYDGWESNILK